MSHRIFTVTLTDLGTYRMTVAAETPADAEAIAKGVMFEEATVLPPGMSVVKREAEVNAEPCTELPVRHFRVAATYSLDRGMMVPAATAEEAERHAQRLYGAQPFPWEHETFGDRVRWNPAREVVS